MTSQASKPIRPQHLRIPKFYRDTLIIISPATFNTSLEYINSNNSYWEEEEKEFWTPTPLKFRCRECKVQVTSEIIFINGKASLSASLILLLIIGIISVLTLGGGLLLLPLALIPLVIKRWKDVKHRCPGCKMPQGLFKRKFGKNDVFVITPGV